MLPPVNYFSTKSVNTPAAKMFRFNKSITLSDYTLIIPSISVGNVGQLTTDLLISSFNLTKIGTVWHKAIIPVYGSNPFDSDSKENCMSCELYGSEKDKFVVLQIRSSVEGRMVNIFLNDLKTSILNEKFKQVIILTSTFSYEMHDLNSGFFRYITNTTMKEVLEKNKVLPLDCTQNRIVIHGCGFAVKLYELLNEETNVTVIVKYASEGDNRPDAVNMLQILYQCLNVNEDVLKNLKFPISWDLVYGSPPPVGIY